MIWRVDVRVKKGIRDVASAGLKADLESVGLAVERAEARRVYLIEAGGVPLEGFAAAAHELLADPVLEEAELKDASTPTPSRREGIHVLVFKKPGVMDPVEESVRKAFRDRGLHILRCRTGHLLLLRTDAPPDQIRRAVLKVFANEVIDEVSIGDRPFTCLDPGRPARLERVEVPLRDLDDGGLLALSRERGLALDLEEMRAIRRYFRSLDRNPTDVELETIAQTWSEHCRHKTLTSDIEIEGGIIPNLLRSTIFRATQEIAHPDCLSVFQDNAGVIAFDESNALCLKVETHNHPSAIEPYGGASTGLGGVIRDILGCGLGARPFASLDVFAVGPPDMPESEIPEGVIHPKRLLRSVVAGVRDYGNRMGIPTVSGAVVFDPRYATNPLVYCGTAGILPRDKIDKGPKPGDRIVLAGGRTGRDGIHGATFSSAHLDPASEQTASTAVQIGNPIVEKRLLDALLVARDEGLYTCITDCGAGGLSSAIGETAARTGAEVHLETVPLKYAGLSCREIWISEAQERMILAVPPRNWDRLRAICRTYGVEATPIGRYTDTGRLVLRAHGTIVGDLDMHFLHEGLPKRVRKAARPDLPRRTRQVLDIDPACMLLKLLAHPDVASKEWIIRQYDHEVQGGSVIKPLCGANRDGPSDAAVVRPVPGRPRGAAIGLGLCPGYSDLDPYHMAACAIDEAVRNVVAVGGDPRRTFLLDNFCWGSPDDPRVLGALVEACRACYDLAVQYGTPFISGKDSLHNEFRIGARVIRIPHTLLITALSIVEDISRCVTMDLKREGSSLYLVGTTRPELGGSLLERVLGRPCGTVPKVHPSPGTFTWLHERILRGGVRACHDLSEGGLAVALAEMAFSGDLGVDIQLDGVADGLSDAELLFSETPTRFLIESDLLEGPNVHRIGTVTGSKRFRIRRAGRVLVDLPISDLKAAWKRTPAW